MAVQLARHLIAAVLVLIVSSPLVRAEGNGTIEGTVTARPARYLPDTVVYLASVPGTHPRRTAEMDQRGMTFVPHILTITAGDTVRFLNHDPLDHNLSSPDCGYDLGTWGQGGQRTRTFDKAGVCTQICKLHPEMLAYIFVGQNPYAAAVDKSGRYTISDVPPGTYELSVWNGHLKGDSRKITVTAGAAAHADLTVHR